jgi:hypothetical protein
VGFPSCLCCLCILHIGFLTREPIWMTLGMYILASEPISVAYFKNPSHQSVCLYVCSPIVAKNKFQQQRSIAGVSFSMRSMSYQRKIDDYFFPELLVWLLSMISCLVCWYMSLNKGNDQIWRWNFWNRTFIRVGTILIVLYCETLNSDFILLKSDIIKIYNFYFKYLIQVEKNYKYIFYL